MYVCMHTNKYIPQLISSFLVPAVLCDPYNAFAHLQYFLLSKFLLTALRLLKHKRIVQVMQIYKANSSKQPYKNKYWRGAKLGKFVNTT